jgi:hypothetical protein
MGAIYEQPIPPHETQGTDLHQVGPPDFFHPRNVPQT